MTFLEGPEVATVVRSAEKLDIVLDGVLESRGVMRGARNDLEAVTGAPRDSRGSAYKRGKCEKRGMHYFHDE